MAEIKNVYCLELIPSSGSSVQLYPGKVVSDITIDSKKYSLSLNSLDFTKRVYEPCHVTADIKIAMLENTQSLPTVDKTVKYFEDFKSLSLKIVSIEMSGPGGHTIKFVKEVGTLGTNYIIMDTRPTYRTGGGSTAMSVILDIYSPDYYFTRRRYSKTYTGVKLGELIDAAVTSFGLGSKLTVMHKYQTFLSYENSQKKDEKGNPVPEELIQPYLVQYNESFYELIARTANRCGEWLYFEDGQLYLGWKAKRGSLGDTTLTADQFQSASFRSRCKEETTDAITSVSRNPIGTDAATGSWNYNMEMSADEYLYPLTKDQFDSASGWRDTEKSRFSTLVAQLLSSDSLYKGLIDFGFNIAKSEATYAQFADKTNKKQNKTYFQNIADAKLDRYNDAKDSATTVTPFSTNPSFKQLEANFKNNVNLDLYKQVRDLQLELDSKILDLDLGGKLQALQVGSILKIPAMSEKKLYMITEVCGTDATMGDTRSESMTVRAIPIDEGKTVMIPLARKQDYVPRGEQQYGYIVDADDPLRLNRVRIRFSWEASNSEGSPWVRMATPYASKDGAGVFYTPQKGDEVVLQFAGGNMERPVVIGSVYNSANTPAYGKHLYDWVFRTPHGHVIKTTDYSDIMAFIGGLIPAIGFARSFAPALVSCPVGEDNGAKKLLGAMQFTDAYGIYNVCLDSAKRQVAIASPFGDVTIDAYTGITISAPNGDVKIVGKNVEIVANNNLTLTSGQNIKNKSINALARGNMSAGDLGKEVLKSIFYDNILKKALDLSLLRTIFETFVKPIEGTLTLKSHRFVKLEAGKGAAHIPSSAYKRPSEGAFGKREITLRKLTSSIERLDGYIDAVVDTYRAKFNNIHEKRVDVMDDIVLIDNFVISSDAIIQRGHADNVREYSLDDITNAIPEAARAHISTRRRKALRDKMNEFIKLINTFDKRDEFKPSILGGLTSEYCLLDKMDSVFKAIPNNDAFKILKKDTNEKFENEAALTEAEINTFKTKYKRLFIVKLIEACMQDAAIKFADATQDFNPTPVRNNAKQGNDIQPADWNNLIAAVIRSEEADNKDATKQDPNGTLVQIMGKIPFVKASERNFYKADNSMGRILISDQEDGNTIQIEEGTLVRHDNTGYSQVLKQLKEICGVPVQAPADPPQDNAQDQHVEENNDEDWGNLGPLL